MGVLDDAIREHLELKRRHGAAEDEIARKEAEALGPARRGPAAADEPGAEAQADERDAVEPPLDAEHAAEADPLPAGPEPTAIAAVPEPEPEPEPDEPIAETEPVPADEETVIRGPEPTIDVPAEAEPPAAIEPPAGDPGPPVHDIDRDPLEPPPPVPKAPPGATVEFDTLSARDDEPVEAGEPGDDDVLEETPEFLRETPEHDRLWFEQKPPRDFDLDN